MSPPGAPARFNQRCGHGTRAVVLEALVVAVTGAVLAFAANAISPRGLKLARDYFPGATRPTRYISIIQTNTAGAANLVTNVADVVAARLKTKNLRPLNTEQVEQLYRDARRAPGTIVFLDSRDEKHYQAGHIPGAHLFDHYRAERYLADVLPICLGAEQVVLYCQGGECEDSEFAAITLRETGIPNDKLAVYTGGFDEWVKAGLPVELGERNSGNIHPQNR